MKKRILSLALVLVMCLGLAVPALAVEIVDSGKCGDNLTWTLDSEGTLTISGTGDMWDFVDASDDEIAGGVSPWDSDGIVGDKRVRTVEIEPGVTSIGRGAFLAHIFLDRVSIPSTVTSIGFGAFYRCGELTSVSISEGVKNIGAAAFLDCFSLADISLPEGVVSIGKSAFADSGLVSLNIPGSVTDIGEGFVCDQLAYISVAPENTRYEIVDGALYDRGQAGNSLLSGTERGLIVHHSRWYGRHL